MMKHILCIQICKLFAALLEMESLAPETRGCRFQWEADQLKFHSRFLHLFHFSARLFLFIYYSSQPSRLYWSPDLSLFILCLSSHFFSLFSFFSPPRVCPAPVTPITPITITPCRPRQPRFLVIQCEMSTVVRQSRIFFLNKAFFFSFIPSSRYSRASCQLECGMKKALSTTDCLPW